MKKFKIICKRLAIRIELNLTEDLIFHGLSVHISVDLSSWYCFLNNRSLIGHGSARQGLINIHDSLAKDTMVNVPLIGGAVCAKPVKAFLERHLIFICIVCDSSLDSELHVHAAKLIINKRYIGILCFNLLCLK